MATNQPQTEMITTSVVVPSSPNEGSSLLKVSGQTNISQNPVPCICGSTMKQTKISNITGSTDAPRCANTQCLNPSVVDSNGLCYLCPSESHPNGFYYCNACAVAVSERVTVNNEEKYESAPPSAAASFSSSDFRNVTSEVSTLTQIQLIIGKNFKTQIKRRKCSFCCKMCCPITFILLMGILGALRPVLNIDINCSVGEWEEGSCDDIFFYEEQHNILNAHTYTAWGPKPFLSEYLCDSPDYDYTNDVQYSSTQPKYIGVVYDDTNTILTAHIESVFNIISTNYGDRGEEYITNDTVGFQCQPFVEDVDLVSWTNGSLLRHFRTTEQLEAYVRDEYYDKSGYNFDNDAENALRPLFAAIEFKAVSHDGKQWDYVLRFDDSQVPSTFDDNEYKIVDRDEKELRYLGYDSVDEYGYSGFVALQSILDRAITEYIAVEMNEYAAFNTTYLDFLKGYFSFPAAHTTGDIFWTIMKTPFETFSAIMFVYPVIQIVSILVTEKSNRIKEGMKMMGMSGSIYWTSMYLWFIMEFTLICCMIVFCGFLFNVFLYSDTWLILIWFWLFCLSQISFSTLISTFFDNPKTATIVGFVLYFVLWAMNFAMASFNKAEKEWFCLLAMPCYMDSINVVIKYENAQLGVQWSNLDEHTGQFSMRTALNMMFIDVILYTLLTLYFDAVWPSRFGQRRSPFFCLTKAWWRSMGCCKGAKVENILPDKLDDMQQYEDVSNNEILKVKDPAILVRELSKTFRSGFRSRNVRAVRDVSLDIYNGEVFCLLGHNGAGKTTTLSMLAGLLSSTSGKAYINGHDTDVSMNAVRRFLGVCPQHDILWDKMTVEEHLRFFAKLKGVKQKEIQQEINRVINSFDMLDSGLWGKFPTAMSGGERRRLSLAISLIGGSEIVFLDEPTSGMDPENRRKVWDIIEKEKKNRCIILTTHYMEEADILGDRVAIMSSGQIKCCGSSLYLKRLYGVGYTFTVSLNSDINLDSDKHSDIKPAIDGILTAIEGVETVSVAATEILYKLPFESSSQFGDVFVQLDQNKDQLDIETFGVSVTTLEEVFLKIGAHDTTSNININDDDDVDDDEQGKGRAEAPKFDRQNTELFEQPEFKLDDRNTFWIFFMHIYAILYKRFWWTVRDFTGLCCQIILPVALVAIIFATLSKPFDLSTYELKLTAHQFQGEYTDTVVVPLTQLDPDYDFSNTSNVYYTDDNNMAAFFAEQMRNTYGHNLSFPIGAASASEQCLNEAYHLALNQKYQDSYVWKTANCTNDFKMHIYNYDNKKNTPYFAFYFYPWPLANFDDPAYNYDYWRDSGIQPAPQSPQHEVLFGLNYSAYHSLPIALNTWNNWVLQNIYDEPQRSAQINVYSHPLPMTKANEAAIFTQVGTAYTMMLVIAFALIPASSIYFVVNEKKVGTKHQQYVSGISIASYWIGTFASDILLGVPSSSLVILLAYLFDIDTFTGAAAMPLWTSLMLFVASSIAASYLIYPFFRSPGKAQFLVIIMNILLSMIFIIMAVTFDFVSPSTGEDFRAVVRVLPIFLLAENLLEINSKDYEHANKSHWHDDVVGRNLKLMAAEACGYFAIILIIEYASSFPGLLQKLGFVVDQPRKYMRLDQDVVAEQERIKQSIDASGAFNPEALQDTVILAGLRKVYKGENKFSPYKPAVRDMYFGVKQGQIFGFLGTNGAGKTSTLNLLIGQNYPSEGAGYINGKSIVSEQLAIRRNIGFCPQNDALFDLLTGYEHLKFYALIKGLSGRELEQQIQVLLNALTLNKYKKRTSTTYSGGNKRKLCVAQSMIGNPPIIFLDEPSTGMDPVSRRFMWKFINHTMAGRAVILTTHSMEECEALCDRVGIMVSGQLSCIGSPNYLKSKFGKGYQLDITVADTALSDESSLIHDLLNEFNKTFPTTILQHNGNKLLLEIRPYDEEDSKLAALGQMFAFVEKIKPKYHVVSYALSQTSLEQVFLKMAEAKGETEEEGNVTADQQELLKVIKSETKEELLRRIAVLNRDYLEEILENKIKNGSEYIVRAIALKTKDEQKQLTMA